jgi:FAD dependent monooxygenase
MTPNQGQGANTAIESAAGLANVLYALRQKTEVEMPSGNEISQVLEHFNKAQFRRLVGIHQGSQFLTRLQACDGLVKFIFARYVAPHCGNLTVAGIAGLATSGPFLDFIPLTERSGRDWQPLPSWAPLVSSLAYGGTRALVCLATLSVPTTAAYTLYKLANSRVLHW